MVKKRLAKPSWLRLQLDDMPVGIRDLVIHTLKAWDERFSVSRKIVVTQFLPHELREIEDQVKTQVIVKGYPGHLKINPQAEKGLLLQSLILRELTFVDKPDEVRELATPWILGDGWLIAIHGLELRIINRDKTDEFFSLFERGVAEANARQFSDYRSEAPQDDQIGLFTLKLFPQGAQSLVRAHNLEEFISVLRNYVGLLSSSDQIGASEIKQAMAVYGAMYRGEYHF